MVNFGAWDTVPERFKGRTLYRHNPSVTLMRTTAEECQRIGDFLAAKLNAMRGPVRNWRSMVSNSTLSACGS